MKRGLLCGTCLVMSAAIACGRTDGRQGPDGSGAAPETAGGAPETDETPSVAGAGGGARAASGASSGGGARAASGASSGGGARAASGATAGEGAGGPLPGTETGGGGDSGGGGDGGAGTPIAAGGEASGGDGGAEIGNGGAVASTPEVEVLSGKIVRLIAVGTSVYFHVRIRAVGFSFERPLFAEVADWPTLFGSEVTVIHEEDGTDILEFPSLASASVGASLGQVTIKLCTNESCSDTQLVPLVSVPFEIEVASESSWPGDHLTDLQPWVGIADWTTFQGNAAHTGFVAVDIEPDQFTTRWQRMSSGVFSPWGASLHTVTTSGGRFFVAENYALEARREDDARLEWSYDFSGLRYPSVNPPAVGGDAVYIAAGQQSSTYLFAFDAADGSPIFKSPMSSQWENYLAPTIGPAGVYTNAGGYGGLFAFDTSGQNLFFGDLNQTDLWTPAVSANAVYAYTGSLTIFDPVTGDVLGDIPDPTFTNYVYDIGGSPVLGAPGSVFVANYVNASIAGNHLLNFDTATQTLRWRVAGRYPRTPAYAAGVVYAVNESPLRLEARAETDGALLWWWTPPAAGDANFVSEVLLTNNLVLVSTNLSTYAIDRATHHTVWSYPQASHLALSKNGILYLEGEAVLTAINVKAQ